MQNLKPGLRTLAAATAFGVALTAGAIGITPAMAAPTTEVNASTIDQTAEASLTVHKRDLGDAAAYEGTGNVDGNAPGAALSGVTFELFRMTSADLSTNDGFVKAAALDASKIRADQLEPVRRGVTDSNGTIEFANLQVGVYLLRETGAPAGYTPAQDSLVFLPMTTPDSNGWNYDVHVYPKNSKTTAEKTVEDAGKHVGDTIKYTITSSIPNLTREGAAITKYEIADDLDETRLAPELNGGSIGLDNGTSFTYNTDYTIGGDQNLLRGSATFTEEGLRKLTEAKNTDSSVKVITTIEAQVTAIGDGAGKITNQAEITSNNGGGGGDTTTKTNTVESFWGKLQINKIGENNARLNDAKFQLFTCTDQDKLLDGPLTVDGKSEWQTEGEGTITIDALQVTDYRNNVPVDAVDKYCLVETKAPKGYELLPEPVAIDFTRDDLKTGTQVVDVQSIKSVAASLPLTGGAGIGLLAALGALIIGAGAWVARRLNRG